MNLEPRIASIDWRELKFGTLVNLSVEPGTKFQLDLAQILAQLSFTC
jgi:hypothetical protein